MENLNIQQKEYLRLINAGFNEEQINQIIKAKEQDIYIVDKILPTMSVEQIRTLRNSSNKNIFKNMQNNISINIKYKKEKQFFDIDLFSVPLTESRTLNTSQICYYNNPKTKGINVEVAEMSKLNIDFSKLPDNTNEILIFASIYGHLVFNNINNLEYEVYNTKNILVNEKICKPNLFGRTILFCTFLKENDNWKLIINNKCYNNDINEVFNTFLLDYL